MGEVTKIEWTATTLPDGRVIPGATFNPWRGCTKVAPGCANCYAETGSKRNPKTLGIWGPNGTRVVAAEKTWGEPLKWNAAAAKEGVRRRVFCASLADVFEDWAGRIHNSAGEEVWVSQRGSRSWEAYDGSQDFAFERQPLTIGDLRARLFALIDATPHLDWLLVTKRPQNVRRMWPSGTLQPGINRVAYWEATGKDSPRTDEEKPFRSNVWLLTSVSDQATYDAAALHLWRCRDLVPVLGFSAEPLLGPIKIYHDYNGQLVRNWAGCWDWWIVGSESGHNRRPMKTDWALALADQCRNAGVRFFMKQMEIGGKVTGDIEEFPENLQIREYPTPLFGQ